MNPLLNLKDLIANEIEVEYLELSDFLLDVTWEYITNLIGYDIMLQEGVETLKGNGTEKLYLTYRPIKKIIETSVNGVTIENPDFEDGYLRLFTRDGEEQSYYTPMATHQKSDTIKVRYEAGYTKVPNQIVMAAISLLSNLKANTGDEGRLKGYKINTISYTFKDHLEKSEEFKDLLRPFMCL